jgi:sphingomyelin phosphodiesterase acid-like 3
MKSTILWRVAFCHGVLAICFVLAGGSASAQVHRVEIGQRTVSALMLSDIHFDPFHDPGKARQLADVPASEWGKILDAPESADQASAFAALQQRCSARGVDTPYALLQSSLHAAREHAPDAKFITVSGDLIAHGFTCRFAAVLPGKTGGDYAAFVEKTIEYVTTELRAAFPGVPVYVALGNNDSNCGDNHLDAGSDFLASVAKSVLAGLPTSANRKEMLSDFTASGSYSVRMAAPMRNTRLIVLDDLFMLTQYATCGGQQDRSAAAAQIAWLQKELDGARLHKEKVWVIGHIPPGVDIYSTFAKMRNVCGGDQPAMFLSSDGLGEVLTRYADVVRLGIFAHTHMDELKLLKSGDKTGQGGVPIKVVPSISPVNGNNPTFTVARVDPASATIKDYAVFEASNHTGVNTSWSKEYDYVQAYHEAAFSPAALEKLIGEFHSDRDAETKASRAYIRNFFAGDSSSLIKPLWPQYVCALSHYTAKAFGQCMCPASPQP